MEVAMRALLAVLILVLASPLNGQPVPEGDEIRVREEKKAPWLKGLYSGHDSTSLIMAEDGIERVHELASLERVDWHKPKNLGLNILIGAGGGALVGIITGAVICSGDDDFFDCSSGTRARATVLSAGIGAGFVLLDYAISQKSWKNVTKHYPPAGYDR